MPRLEYGLAALHMIRDLRYKYVEAPRPELYDLRGDPGERHDLAAGDPDRAHEMAALLSRWEGSTTDDSAAAGSRRTLTREEEERLKSLGYLGGDFFKTGSAAPGGLADPKDRIDEIRRVHASRERFSKGDAAGALSAADEILRENPRSQEARNTRILALIQLERYPEAEKEALAALAAAEADRDNTSVLAEKARSMLASAYRLEGKLPEAEELYRHLLKDDPRRSLIAVDFAGLLGETGRGAEGLKVLRDVLARDPRNGMAIAARFEIESRQGDRQAALRSAAALADARAGDAATLVDAGLLLLEAGQPARAATCFEVAQGQNVRPDPELFGQIGAARMAAGQVDEAKKAFLAMGQARPADPRPHYYLGMIALQSGDEAGARASFGRSLELAPSFTAPLVTYARYLASRGARAEALRTLEDALRRNPSDADARKALETVRGASPGR